jgi:hypothetical protein
MLCFRDKAGHTLAGGLCHTQLARIVQYRHTKLCKTLSRLASSYPARATAGVLRVTGNRALRRTGSKPSCS